MNGKDDMMFPTYIERLKQLSRTGWQLSGIPKSLGESIAEHSWGTSVFALLLSLELRENGKDVNIEKTLAMAIIHDLAESLTSDIPRSALQESKTLTDDIKREAEREAMKRISAHLEHSRDDLLDLHLEMQQIETLEAKIVHAADLLDMMNHARWLNSIGIELKIVEPFISSALARIKEINIPSATRLAQRIARNPD